ncbi:MAG: hypothetical protein ACRET2_15160, partial [Steroidobacteraceae bacterium]
DVNQDAITRYLQDLLIRPIRRGDLILAKLLFLVLLVQGPELLADFGAGLAHGFAIAASFEAALARNVATLCMLVLPAMMLALVTRSVMEFLIVALAVVVGLTAIFLVGVVLLLGIKTSLGGTGLSWMMQMAWYVLAVAGTLVVLTIQYRWRRTALGRGLIGAGGAVLILSAFLPWRAAFAIQEKVAPEPQAARSIELTFDASSGRSAIASSVGTSPPAGELYLPLRITGIPAAGTVLMDRAMVRIRDMSGRELYEGRTNLSVDGYGSIEDAQFEVRQGHAEAADRFYQRIFLPAAIMARVANRPVEMDIQEFLTLYRPAATDSLPALSGHERLGGLGRCTTGIDGDGDEIEVSCISTGRSPACFTAFLEYMPTGVRNPEVHDCEPDYTPFDGHIWPDALSRGHGALPFLDRSGLTHYPVDGAKLGETRLFIETYAPRAHFTRRVSIPRIRLQQLMPAHGS